MNANHPIGQFKPYPAYRPSGVEWLGDVPEHWDVRRLKQVCSESALYGANVAATQYQAEGIRFLRTTDIAEDGRLFGEGVFLPAELVEEYVLSDGDILLSRSGTVGRSFLYAADLHGPCAYAGYLVRFVPNAATLPKYLFFFTKTEAFNAFLRVMAISSTIENVNGEKYANMPIPLPPPPEQRAIVRYLDYVDRRIRRYVDAKRRLIALLEEERQAVVDRAVTRGLDANVRLKPSGVGWLGDVPEHWEVRRLGYLATKFGSGITPRGGATVYQESGIPLLRSQNIHFDGLRMQDVARISPSLHEELAGTHVKPGDVLLNITGASIGRTCSVPDDFAEGNVNQHVCIIRPSKTLLLPKLLAAYLSTPMMQREIQVEQSGASREGLTLQSIRSFRVIVPPPSEQRAIVEYLDRATAEIDAAIARARRQMELVEEYRTRLIADVVTGKLDVREAAAQLPDESDEHDPVEGVRQHQNGLAEAIYDAEEEPAIAEEVRT